MNILYCDNCKLKIDAKPNIIQINNGSYEICNTCHHLLVKLLSGIYKARYGKKTEAVEHD